MGESRLTKYISIEFCDHEFTFATKTLNLRVHGMAFSALHDPNTDDVFRFAVWPSVHHATTGSYCCSIKFPIKIHTQKNLKKKRYSFCTFSLY